MTEDEYLAIVDCYQRSMAGDRGATLDLFSEGVPKLLADWRALQRHDKEATDLTIDQQVEIGRLWADNERLRARLDAAERLIEVVRAREIGTAGGVGAAFEAYDALGREKEC